MRCEQRISLVAVDAKLNRSMQDLWCHYHTDVGLRPELINAYSNFLGKMDGRNVPPIFESQHLSLLVGIEERYLHSMTFSTGSFYRTFKIKKKSGGYREISTPYASLREVQTWIKTNILDKIEIHKTATGFVKKKDIVYNARIHSGRDKLLKLDIKDFFPSISLERVVKIFSTLGYPNNVSFMLAKICTLNGTLPQGAVTSPSISNIVMKRYDTAMYSYAKKNMLRYTRYADDIAVSGSMITPAQANFFVKALTTYGFSVNEKKYLLLGNGDKKIVTGLDISTGDVRVTRQFRREITKDIFFVWSAGLETHVAREKIFNPFYLEHLAGRLEFWRRVEPNNPQLIKALSRLKAVRSR